MTRVPCLRWNRTSWPSRPRCHASAATQRRTLTATLRAAQFEGPWRQRARLRPPPDITRHHNKSRTLFLWRGQHCATSAARQHASPEQAASSGCICHGPWQARATTRRGDNAATTTRHARGCPHRDDTAGLHTHRDTSSSPSWPSRSRCLVSVVTHTATGSPGWAQTSSWETAWQLSRSAVRRAQTTVARLLQQHFPTTSGLDQKQATVNP